MAASCELNPRKSSITDAWWGLKYVSVYLLENTIQC